MSARIVVLVSGEGRNLQALIDACSAGHIDGRIVGVLSNRAAARGLVRAGEAGIETAAIPHQAYPTREAFDAAMVECLQRWQPDIVVLAGFMRILTPVFVQAFAGRMLNIHPSLLPRHPGLHTHQAVLDAGDAEHGATVHFVTEALDGGPAIIQGQFTVAPEDTAQVLAQRVMSEIELKIYPQAVAWMARGDLHLTSQGVMLNQTLLRAPLGLAAVEACFR